MLGSKLHEQLRYVFMPSIIKSHMSINQSITNQLTYQDNNIYRSVNGKLNVQVSQTYDLFTLIGQLSLQVTYK